VLGPTLLRGVRPVGASPADVRIDGGVFGPFRPAASRTDPGTRPVDCGGLVLLPAFVDLHTHLREPGGEEAETIAGGTAAAAAGGYADVFAMANCAPVTDSPDRIRHVLDVARRTASCRVHAVGAATVGLDGVHLAPLREMVRAGAEMFSDDGRCVDDPALVRAVLEVSATTGAPFAQHAQCGRLAGDGQINAGHAARGTGLAPWPAAAEESIVARDAVLSTATGGRLHVCHVSTAGTVETVREAKRRGRPVTAEVAPHHLLLTDALTAQADPRYKVNPPLRGAADVAALREGLRDGTLDAVATDHAPHPAHRKKRPWDRAAFGMTGLETALAVVADVLDEDGRPDWSLVAERMAYGPARAAGLTARAGRPPAVGEPATFTLVEPGAAWTVDAGATAGRSQNTPFAGRRFRHRVVATVVSGFVTHDALGLFGG
jgi:dihydroorotase